MKNDELKFAENKEIVSLEQAVTNGTKALIPFEFEYPNSDLTVEVALRPITLNSLGNTQHMTTEELGLKMVQEAVYNPDGSEISSEVIGKLPIGTIYLLSEEISRISGLNMDSSRVDELKKFP
jgi:hypothetical protein